MTDHHESSACCGFSMQMRELPTDAMELFALLGLVTAVSDWEDYREALQMFEQSIDVDTTCIPSGRSEGATWLHKAEEAVMERPMPPSCPTESHKPKKNIKWRILSLTLHHFVL